MTFHSQHAPAKRPTSRSMWRHLFSAWILAYLLPGILVFGIREHFRRQEELRQEQERNHRIAEQVRAMNPDEMSQPLRMLFGVERGEPAPVGLRQANGEECK